MLLHTLVTNEVWSGVLHNVFLLIFVDVDADSTSNGDMFAALFTLSPLNFLIGIHFTANRHPLTHPAARGIQAHRYMSGRCQARLQSRGA